MPLFHKETPQERAQKESVERDAEIQEKSQRQLQAGGLPVRAQERIAQIRSGERSLYSSDLSVDEFLLTSHSGFEPVGLVAGSCVYHVGWNRWGQTGELDAQTRAMAGAAYSAISRLEQEAAGMGALGVAGVRFEVKQPAWGETLVEVVAIGTALRARGAGAHSARPFTSGISGQELWSLLQAGIRPVALVFGNSAFYIHSGWATRMQDRSWYNQEVMSYTAGVYEAQKYAFGRMHGHASDFGAHGVMGVHIEHAIEEIEYEVNDVSYTDYVVKYMSWGTAVVQAPGAHLVTEPSIIMDLEDAARTVRDTGRALKGE